MILPNVPKFLKSMWLALLWRLKRKPLIVPVEIRQYRQGICNPCPYRVDEQCRVCTCFISVKVMLSSEACPKGYWPQLSKPVTSHYDAKA